ISFFSSRRRHTSFSRDWSSDVCSSDLAGIGILEQASPMIQDFFSSVTPQAAAGFVGLLSLANLVGRFGWSTASDKLGRKRAYMRSEERRAGKECRSRLKPEMHRR